MVTGMHAHLLFVEETPGSLHAMRAALERTGLTGSVIAGFTRLEPLLRSVCPDLVVVEAPGPDTTPGPGRSAVEIVRRTYAWLPVVVLATDSGGDTRGGASALGADLVVSEPEPDGETVRRIRTLLFGTRTGRLA
jgi:DNA-binding NarL/FixJ family response regulator